MLRFEELSSSVIEKIITIEAQNMIPILAKVGIFLSEKDIREQNLKNKKDFIILSSSEESPLGFIRYELLENSIFIKSIQLKDGRFSYTVFKDLLQKAASSFSKHSVEKVESVVQVSNDQSIRLHEKLGFVGAKESEKATRYSVKLSLLVNRVSCLE